MDILSEGRVDIGLGAGWMISDYDQSGMSYDRPGIRIERFVEGLDVIIGLMTGEPFSYRGSYYRISDHAGFPTPVQRPSPPILIGDGGRRILTIAAERADIVGINGTLEAGVIGPAAIATMTEHAVIDKLTIVAEAAAAVGRLDHIEMNIRTFFVSVTDHRSQADRRHRLTDRPRTGVDRIIAVRPHRLNRRDR